MSNSTQDAVVTLSGPVSVCDENTLPSLLEEEVIRLYDESRHALLRYLTSLGVAPSDGEEIVQEVFFCLFRHLRRGKSRENLRAWIFRVARNLALRQHRSKRRRPEELFGLAVTPGDEPVDPLPNPEERTINEHRERRLVAVLDALPERERQSIHLRAEGLGYREIASVLGIPLSTLARLIDRSLKQLQRVYED